MVESFVRPETLASAIALLASDPSARAVAGGTDLMVELGRGIKPARLLVDLTGLGAELDFLEDAGPRLRIGALASHNRIIASPLARAFALPLVQACIEIGAPQIRTRATLAGNVVTASPANDTIAALYALDAEIEIAGPNGARIVPIGAFFPAFRQTVLAPGELIRAISVRKTSESRRGIFLKLGLRRAQAISVIDVAVVVEFAGTRVADARIALGCVAPTVVRASEAEAALLGEVLDGAACARAASLSAESIAPIDDVRATAGYRREAVAALVARALQRIVDGTEAEGTPSVPVLLESGASESLRATSASNSAASAFDGTVIATINGATTHLENATHLSLLDALRDRAGLTGAKEGCAEGECGACTVWLDGKAVMSCLVPAPQAHGSEITTIEGLADGPGLHPLQQAFVDHAAVQCGFCIPGMLMSGAMLLAEKPDASTDDARAAISGNLCRCTGYRKILDAMDAARTALEPERIEARA
jgi:carbon-monoxide dehydrogenase medium subunit